MTEILLGLQFSSGYFSLKKKKFIFPKFRQLACAFKLTGNQKVCAVAGNENF